MSSKPWGHSRKVHSNNIASFVISFSLLLLALMVVGCGEDTFSPDLEQKQEEIPGFDFVLPCPLTGFDENYLFATAVSRDGIPPIDRPAFSPSSAVTWLSGEERVLGAVIEGEAIAFPIRIMIWHEVVNVSTETGRYSITYCPLTFTGIGFDVEDSFPGEGQSLGVSGLLYNSNLVLYDRKTDSLWPQMNWSAYGGPEAGSCLELMPVMDTTLRFWKAIHPDTKVLDRPGRSTSWNKYSVNPYEAYWANEEISFPTSPPDGRLPNKEWVLGVVADTGAKAFPIVQVPVINDSLPGVPFVVFNHWSENTLVAYKAWVIDGESLHFGLAGVTGGVPSYRDLETGSTWNIEGRCTEGPLAGSVLERMPSYLSFYFAWDAYFPATSIYSQ